jgi:hypothetical protein
VEDGELQLILLGLHHAELKVLLPTSHPAMPMLMPPMPPGFPRRSMISPLHPEHDCTASPNIGRYPRRIHEHVETDVAGLADALVSNQTYCVAM